MTDNEPIITAPGEAVAVQHTLDETQPEGVDRYLMFDITLQGIASNDIYWDAPTSARFYSNGDWYIFATRCANMHRTGGIIDSGKRLDFSVDIVFTDANGSAVHSAKYWLIGVNYKDEEFNAESRGCDKRFAQFHSEMHTANWTQIVE